MDIIFQQIILGIIQGIVEWLPISSEGVLVLVMANFFNTTNIDFLVKQALFLHLGTFFAALIYFRKDVIFLTKQLFSYKKAKKPIKNVLNFLIITTIISGLFGFFLLKFVLLVESSFILTGKIITFIIGILLLITAFLQLKSQDTGFRKAIDLDKYDTTLLGFIQGLAVLPGLSRSGLTISTLLLRKVNKTLALKLSFLMSLPIVFFGNLILNINDFAFDVFSLIGLLFSFIFGILTIHFFMKLSKKVNFGIFVLIFAIIVLLSGIYLILFF